MIKFFMFCKILKKESFYKDKNIKQPFLFNKHVLTPPSKKQKRESLFFENKRLVKPITILAFNDVTTGLLKKKIYTPYSKLSEVKLLTIGIASPLRILQWAEKTLPNGKIYGEVLNANTLHHKTFKPQKGGLFCERIFGPLKDFECACGKVDKSAQQEKSLFSKKKEQNKDIPFKAPIQIRKYCTDCDVEFTWSVIRRYQLGYIKLISPVTHIWFLKGTPSYLSLLLDIKKRHLQFITYCTETLTLENSVSFFSSNTNKYQSSLLFIKPEISTSSNVSNFYENNTSLDKEKLSYNKNFYRSPSSSLEGFYTGQKACAEGVLSPAPPSPFGEANLIIRPSRIDGFQTIGPNNKAFPPKAEGGLPLPLIRFIIRKLPIIDYKIKFIKEKLNKIKSDLQINSNVVVPYYKGMLSLIRPGHKGYYGALPSFVNLYNPYNYSYNYSYNYNKVERETPPLLFPFPFPLLFKRGRSKRRSRRGLSLTKREAKSENHKARSERSGETSQAYFSGSLDSLKLINFLKLINTSLYNNSLIFKKKKTFDKLFSSCYQNTTPQNTQYQLQPLLAYYDGLSKCLNKKQNSYSRKERNNKSSRVISIMYKIFKKLPINLYIISLKEKKRQRKILSSSLLSLPSLHLLPTLPLESRSNKNNKAVLVQKSWESFFKQAYKKANKQAILYNSPLYSKNFTGLMANFFYTNKNKDLNIHFFSTLLEDTNNFIKKLQDLYFSLKTIQKTAAHNSLAKKTYNMDVTASSLLKDYLIKKEQSVQNNAFSRQNNNHNSTKKNPSFSPDKNFPSFVGEGVNLRPLVFPDGLKTIGENSKTGVLFSVNGEAQLLHNSIQILKVCFLNHVLISLKKKKQPILTSVKGQSVLSDVNINYENIAEIISLQKTITNLFRKSLSVSNFIEKVFIPINLCISYDSLHIKKEQILLIYLKNILKICERLFFASNKPVIFGTPHYKSLSDRNRAETSVLLIRLKLNHIKKQVYLTTGIFSFPYYRDTNRTLIKKVIYVFLGIRSNYYKGDQLMFPEVNKKSELLRLPFSTALPSFDSIIRFPVLRFPFPVFGLPCRFTDLQGKPKVDGFQTIGENLQVFSVRPAGFQRKTIGENGKRENKGRRSENVYYHSQISKTVYLPLLKTKGVGPYNNNNNNKDNKTKKRLFNNIYTLSHRERWQTEKDWPLFLMYNAALFDSTDIPIFTYEKRLSLLPPNSISHSYNNIQKNETSEFNLSSAFFSGPGMVKQLLDELNFKEIQKLDKQNRLLLYQLNKIILKLKKQVQLFVFDKASQNELKELCKKRDLLIRRTKLVRKIFKKDSTPSTMMITILPVLPPDLRPIVKMGGQIAASDLNRLYQRVIYRNERLKKFLKDPATSHSYEMKYAQRLLQESIDNLIQNGKSGLNTEKDSRGRSLKSLSDSLKGKQGRFRQFLLGKRVDYSGRSVIVVGPKLKLHECGLPLEMAKELYLPFLLKILLNRNYAKTVIGAKTLIKNNPALTQELLREILQVSPVLLNRAPTLHRLGFQAFVPKLVEGRAILLHPLVCSAFNADFDGDQMAVHVPITIEARAEAWKLMLARNNMLSPATGDPLTIPSQDMILGCYYLTTYAHHGTLRNLQGSGLFFNNLQDALKAYSHKKIDLHALIWVKWTGHIENGNDHEEPLEIRLSSNGNWQEISANYHRLYNSANLLVNQYMATTPGRILFNSLISKHLF